MKMMKLKNGSEEAQVVVTTSMLSLRALFNDNPIAFYELTQKAKNPKHKCFGNTQQILTGLSLLDDNGNIHDSVKNVLLSAIDGEGTSMTFGNPIVAR